ncbi:hypothetical protein [Sulfuriferula multivorans]|uniref:hypothetical protein n=1 Tax=Sulfuriferula multivorans TaxID=1559896 RepID=UPI000F5BCB26|nr:hypothetical protein [Sulfuriferula multivorans]
MHQGFISYLVAFNIVYFGTNGYLDLKMPELDQTWILWSLPSIPLFLRLIMLWWFYEFWSEVLSEGERDTESGRILSLTLCGFSVSAFFVLIATNPTFVDKHIDIELPTYFMLISSVGLFGAFSIEAYKHRRWQQQLCLGLEEAGRFSLLASIATLMWVSQFSDRLKFIVIAVCTLMWSIDFLHRMSMWVEFLSSKRRYKNGHQ